MRGKYENFPYAVWPRTCMHVCMVFSFSRFHLFTTPWTVAHQVPLSMDSPGKNTGVGCHDFLQGIFPTQGLNLCLLWLLHRRQILYQGSYLGSPTYIAKYYYQHPLLKWCICCNWWTKWTQSLKVRKRSNPHLFHLQHILYHCTIREVPNHTVYSPFGFFHLVTSI